MSIPRLRTDVQFAVLVMFCVVALAGITPFVVFRLVHGEWVVGTVDAAIVASLAGTLAYAWRDGN